MATTTINATIVNCTTSGGAAGGVNSYASCNGGDTCTATVFAKNTFATSKTGGSDFYASTGAGGGTETANMTNTNCASADGTADDFGGSGNLVNLNATIMVVNRSGDLRPRLNGNLINAGLNLYGTITTDVVGNNRPRSLNWTIGAWIPIMWHQ